MFNKEIIDEFEITKDKILLEVKKMLKSEGIIK